MGTEPDQTRWVGIRPTPDCNDIPTTTRKLAPAISDLQAIKDSYGYTANAANLDCSVSGQLSIPVPPVDEIWVLTNIMLVNETTICDMRINPWVNGSGRLIKAFFSVEPGIEVSWHGMLVIVWPDFIRCYFDLGGALDTVRVTINGYKIGVY